VSVNYEAAAAAAAAAAATTTTSSSSSANPYVSKHEQIEVCIFCVFCDWLKLQTKLVNGSGDDGFFIKHRQLTTISQ
jgi:hypothetical protein